MTNVQRLEEEILKLNQSELAEFRQWFEKFDGELFDEKIESDMKSGKLDKLAQQAIKDYENGKYKKI